MACSKRMRTLKGFKTMGIWFSDALVSVFGGNFSSNRCFFLSWHHFQLRFFFFLEFFIASLHGWFRLLVQCAVMRFHKNTNQQECIAQVHNKHVGTVNSGTEHEKVRMFYTCLLMFLCFSLPVGGCILFPKQCSKSPLYFYNKILSKWQLKSAENHT